jgi:DNA-binding HxlR family transcriptional regulator
VTDPYLPLSHCQASVSRHVQVGPVADIIVERTCECPVTKAVAVIAGKGKPTSLCEIREAAAPQRSTPRHPPGVSEKVPSRTRVILKRMGSLPGSAFYEAGVLASAYGVTDYGRTLIPALNTLAQWETKQHSLRRA